MGRMTDDALVQRGFRQLDFETSRLVIDASFEAPARRLGLLEADGLASLLAETLRSNAGRTETRIVALPDRSERLHVRPLHHGGLLGPVLGRRWLGLARPLLELDATARLRSRGAPVPRPVFVLGRRDGLFWEAALATIHEEESVDARQFLAGKPVRGRLRRAARAAGGAVRAFHDAGGRHADLQIGNLLVRERDEACEVIVIDLDRARVTGCVSGARRMTELMRLYRSLVKRGLLDGVDRQACATFLSGYLAGDRALRRSLLRHLPRERVRLAVHALGYRVAGHSVRV